MKLKRSCGGKDKQRCLSVGSRSVENDVRFKAVNPETLANLAKPYAPKNTRLNTQWAMNNLRDWWKWHNSLSATEKCPEVVLSADCSANELNIWLPVYVAVMKNKEGKRYHKLWSTSTGTSIRRLRIFAAHYVGYFSSRLNI